MQRVQITRLEIKEYRSIKSADIKLSELNILIGANGAGKSTFIALLQLFSCAIRGDKGHPCSHRLKKGVNAVIFFKADGIEHHINALVKDNEIAIDGDETAIGIFKQLVGDWAFYQFNNTSHQAAIKSFGELMGGSPLMHDAGNTASFLYHMKKQSPKAYSRVIEAVRAIIPYFEDFILTPEDGNIMLCWREIGVDEIFEATQMSDGTLRAIALVTLLMQPDLPSLICIDEPELGLHPYAIGVMAELIKNASARAQIIISTQSVELVNHFNLDDLIVVERREGQSVFNRLEREQYQSWLEDYTLGELWKANVIGGKPSR